MKLRKPLQPRYGKLTVGQSYVTENGRYMTQVRCDCGTKKLVHTSALRSGRTVSCGSSACRPQRATPSNPLGRPLGGHGLPPCGPERDARLTQLYNRTVLGLESVYSVSAELDIKRATAYTLVRKMKKFPTLADFLETQKDKTP